MTFVAAASTASLPARAQDNFALPAGCTAYVTIQNRDCSVSHLFTCEGDVEGHQRRADFDRDGLFYVGEIDFETQWINSFSVRSNSTSVLMDGATDPANLTELIGTGRDDFDFSTMSDVFGQTRHIGEDRLTGESVVIDGVTLDVTNFEASAYDSGGALLYSSKGQEFIHPEWRTFIGGTRIITADGAVTESDSRPVAFDFPGEAGFLSTAPRYGCDTVISMLEGRP